MRCERRLGLVAHGLRRMSGARRRGRHASMF
jgi:hypothetical protein